MIQSLVLEIKHWLVVHVDLRVIHRILVLTLFSFLLELLSNTLESFERLLLDNQLDFWKVGNSLVKVVRARTVNSHRQTRSALSRFRLATYKIFEVFNRLQLVSLHLNSWQTFLAKVRRWEDWRPRLRLRIWTGFRLFQVQQFFHFISNLKLSLSEKL